MILFKTGVLAYKVCDRPQMATVSLFCRIHSPGNQQWKLEGSLSLLHWHPLNEVLLFLPVALGSVGAYRSWRPGEEYFTVVVPPTGSCECPTATWVLYSLHRKADGRGHCTGQGTDQITKKKFCCCYTMRARRTPCKPGGSPECFPVPLAQ